MQSTLVSIIEELQSLLQNVKNAQSRYLSEILALERIVNHVQKATPFIQKQTMKDNIKNEKKEIFTLSVQEKVNALITDIETRQRNIQNQHIQTKPKFQIKPPQIIIQKKPPLPTMNRNEKTTKYQPPSYIPPRNKNQVTGKVTQTTLRSSGQKVFRPEKGSLKKNDIKQQIKSKERSSVEKRSSVQKRPQRKDIKIEPVIKKQVNVQVQRQVKPQIKIQTHSRNVVDKSIETKKQIVKIPKIKLATFQKQIEQILQQLLGDSPKNHKKQLQKLLSDCTNEQLGNKKNQDNFRRIFIKKSNNYCLSRHAVYPLSSFEISRKKWTYHPQLNSYHTLIDFLIDQLQKLSLQNDCKIDKKSQFRITHSHQVYSEIIDEIRNDSQNAKESVPQKLQLSFRFAEQQEIVNEDDQCELQRLSECNINAQLIQLLDQIGEKGTLERGELRGIQVLSQVGIFRNRRSPVLVMRKQYQSWKDHYSSLQQP